MKYGIERYGEDEQGIVQNTQLPLIFSSKEVATKAAHDLSVEQAPTQEDIFGIPVPRFSIVALEDEAIRRLESNE